MLKYVALFFCLTFSSFLSSLASAQGIEDALTLPNGLTFVVSGGYWTEEKEVDGQTVETGGYYRLSSIMRADKTSVLVLQKIENTQDGPVQALTIDIEEISNMGAYILDMRPESSLGSASAPGFAAYVYLKTDLNTVEPETYSIYIDDLDDIYVEPASN
ncbi:MAG: hypothetical protein JJ858_17845 [Rhizobiaceae bacterium]|nr:hypothetical protein [Rhizobiaceae bacterium]